MLHTDHTLIKVAGDVLVGLVFLTQALGALPKSRFEFHSGRLRDRNIPAPSFVLICGLAMMFAGSAMVMLDVYPGIGAVLLIVFTVIATVLFQNFWTISDAVKRREKRGAFFNNLAILGGVLLVLAAS